MRSDFRRLPVSDPSGFRKGMIVCVNGDPSMRVTRVGSDFIEVARLRLWRRMVRRLAGGGD